VDFPLGKDTFFYGNRAGSSVPLYATAQFSAIAGLVGMVRF
jgi:hypothetical protein